MSDNTTMPKVTFSTFILSLASATLVQLGEIPEPESQKKQPNKMLAKHSIDLLNMLQTKTKGNLDAQEQQMLDNMLFELKMKYVQNFGEKN
ncbi:MAG: DUF1844 domain-containing protein [Desulfovibrionaceae bacterium]|nr:DUF1844 domain-containing protein [Desulfovibrionaceae bacterium]